MPGTGSDTPVQRAGQLEQQIRTFFLLPDEEVGHQIPAFLFTDAFDDLDTGRPQAFDAAGSHRIGIAQADDHAPDARLKDAVGAGRRPALMVAGFKGDDKGALARVHAFFGRVTQAVHFGMGLAAGMVPAFGKLLSVTHEDGPHRRVGAGQPAATFGKGHGSPHEGFVHRRIRHAVRP